MPRRLNKRQRFLLSLAAVGFTFDNYDLFVLNTVLVIWTLHYGALLTPVHLALLAASLFAGTVIGMFSFGIIADSFGRAAAYVATLLLVIVGAVGTTLVVTPDVSVFVGVVVMFRLLLGIGVGGEYPLSATISAEASHDIPHRGKLIMTASCWRKTMRTRACPTSSRAPRAAGFVNCTPRQTRSGELGMERSKAPFCAPRPHTNIAIGP